MKLVLVLLLLSCICACITIQTPSHRPESNRGGLGLEPGDRAVARWRNSFQEGTVITVQGKLVTMAWDLPPPERSQLPRHWLQPLKARGGVPQKGTWLLCNLEGSWDLCRVDRVEGQAKEFLQVIRAMDGDRQPLARAQTLPLPTAIRQWAIRRGEMQLTRSKQSRQINPTVPDSAGNAVIRGQRVIARWTGEAWLEATVLSVDADLITIRWLDGSGDKALARAYTAEVPENDMALVKADDLAFCKWGNSLQWWPARVDQVNPTALTVTFKNGRVSKLPLNHCIPARQ
jgi:hypothetical protein